MRAVIDASVRDTQTSRVDVTMKREAVVVSFDAASRTRRKMEMKGREEAPLVQNLVRRRVEVPVLGREVKRRMVGGALPRDDLPRSRQEVASVSVDVPDRSDDVPIAAEDGGVRRHDEGAKEVEAALRRKDGAPLQRELPVNRDEVEQRSEAVDMPGRSAGVRREVVSIASRDEGKRDGDLPLHGIEVPGKVIRNRAAAGTRGAVIRIRGAAARKSGVAGR